MYSKQETAQLKKEFWTALGQYLAPLPSAEGNKINWINYKTGEKHIHFRTEADNRSATIGIELSHLDSGIRQLYFEQFLQYKRLLEEVTGEEWTWQLHTEEGVKAVSKIYTGKQEVSVFKREDWPQLISFFKPRLIALDEFWSRVKYGFEALR